MWETKPLLVHIDFDSRKNMEVTADQQTVWFPFELSRDITEISPLWELLPFNLSWSPIGSRQSNDWPIVAKHANMTSSRQYKCDARDNYIRIFYFTLNSWWLQCVRSARDPSNRWISISTASPAWAWPTPRRRWTSPTVDIARTCRSACSGPAAMWFAACSGWGSLPPACRWWAPPLLAAGAPSCRAAEPNGRRIRRFPSPRTVSAPLPILRDS